MHQCVKLWEIEMFMYTKLDKDIFVLMEGFEAVIKCLKFFHGMRLELGIADEVKESVSNCKYLQASDTCGYT